ncbi:hypothetical protein C8R47DRAFT_1067800 [Mycena vitilis]|nr:hypothetical protein C8R47DRAFT_1067800 [Mycena vitilis]
MVPRSGLVAARVPLELLHLIIRILVGEQDSESAADIHRAAKNLKNVVFVSKTFHNACVGYPPAWVNIVMDSGVNDLPSLLLSESALETRLERSGGHALRIVFSLRVIDSRSSTSYRDRSWGIISAHHSRWGVLHLSAPRRCSGKLLCLRGVASCINISHETPRLKAMSLQFYARDSSAECADHRHETVTLEGHLFQKIAASIPIFICRSYPTTFRNLTFLELRNQPFSMWKDIMLLAPNLRGIDWYGCTHPPSPGLRILLPHLSGLILRDALPPPIHAANLERLIVRDPDFTEHKLESFTDRGDFGIESIRSLRFLDNPFMDDHHLGRIIRSCFHLSDVAINNHSRDRLGSLWELGNRVATEYLSNRNGRPRLQHVVVSNVPWKVGPAKRAFDFLVRMGWLRGCVVTFHPETYRVLAWCCRATFNDREPIMVEELRAANGFDETLLFVSVPENNRTYERVYKPCSAILVFATEVAADQCISKGVKFGGEWNCYASLMSFGHDSWTRSLLDKTQCSTDLHSFERVQCTAVQHRDWCSKPSMTSRSFHGVQNSCCIPPPPDFAAFSPTPTLVRNYPPSSQTAEYNLFTRFHELDAVELEDELPGRRGEPNEKIYEVLRAEIFTLRRATTEDSFDFNICRTEDPSVPRAIISVTHREPYHFIMITASTRLQPGMAVTSHGTTTSDWSIGNAKMYKEGKVFEEWANKAAKKLMMVQTDRNLYNVPFIQHVRGRVRSFNARVLRKAE